MCSKIGPSFLRYPLESYLETDCETVTSNNDSPLFCFVVRNTPIIPAQSLEPPVPFLQSSTNVRHVSMKIFAFVFISLNGFSPPEKLFWASAKERGLSPLAGQVLPEEKSGSGKTYDWLAFRLRLSLNQHQFSSRKEELEFLDHYVYLKHFFLSIWWRAWELTIRASTTTNIKR